MICTDHAICYASRYTAGGVFVCVCVSVRVECYSCMLNDK